jgi:hypothetical protein
MEMIQKQHIYNVVFMLLIRDSIFESSPPKLPLFSTTGVHQYFFRLSILAKSLRRLSNIVSQSVSVPQLSPIHRSYALIVGSLTPETACS